MSSQSPIDPVQEGFAETQQLLRKQTESLIAAVGGLQGVVDQLADLRAVVARVESRQEQDTRDLKTQSQQALTSLAMLPQQPLTISAGSLASLRTDVSQIEPAIAEVKANLARLEPEITGLKARIDGFRSSHQADIESIRAQIREQKESRWSKIGSWVIPVLLTAGAGFFVWNMQISTNQRIDEASKKLATRLSISEAFQKKKLSVYEDADKQIAALVGNLEDLQLNPGDVTQRTAAFDNVRKLTDLSKNNFYMTDEVSKELSDLAFTIATSSPLNGQQGNMANITDMVKKVVAQMKKEFQGLSLD